MPGVVEAALVGPITIVAAGRQSSVLRLWTV